MKKKIANLMQDERLLGNADFESLQKAHQQSKSKVQKAKVAKAKAKLAIQNFEPEAGKKDQETLFALRTAFQQAKAMQHFHRLGFDLAKFRLTRWLENWLHEVSEPHEWVLVKPEKEPKKSKKTIKTETFDENLED